MVGWFGGFNFLSFSFPFLFFQIKNKSCNMPDYSRTLKEVLVQTLSLREKVITIDNNKAGETMKGR